MSEEAVTPPETTAAPAATAPKRLSAVEWEQIVILWESGSVSLQDLSDRYGIAKPSLSQGLSKRGAVKGARAKEFARPTEDALKSDSTRRLEEIRQFRDKYHKYSDFILQSAVKELNEVIKIPRKERTREQNSRLFTWHKYVAEILAICRDQKFHLYDLYNEQEQGEELPEIGVTQYTPEEIEAIREKTEMPLLDETDPLIESAIETLAEMEVPEAS